MSKTESDHLKKIETSWLKKHDYFCGYKGGSVEWTHGFSGEKSSISISVSTYMENDQHIRFSYTQTDHSGQKKDFEYKVPLVTTPCGFGGKRYWFKCPMFKSGTYCGRRVGVLYKDGDYFACRHCYELTYASRNENRRYQYHPLFRATELNFKMEKQMETIKRRTWRGKPTRKWKRFVQLEKQAEQAYQWTKRLGLLD